MMLILVATLFSQVPADAPTDAPRDMITKTGDVVPFNGYCVEEKEFIAREKVNAKNAYVATEAQKSLLITPAVFVGIVLGAIATGVALTLGATEIKRVIDKKE